MEEEEENPPLAAAAAATESYDFGGDSARIKKKMGDFMSWPAAERAEFMNQVEGVFHRSPVYQDNKMEMMRHLMKITGAMLR